MTDANFVVYKSSAGSGKTFTLVKEYLKLALNNKQQLSTAYKGILAITFTNKAASEMKSRIIKALKEISLQQNDFLHQLIADELNISKDELKERAEIVLNQILHHYSDFSIGTIDSFTHRIIRTFALDLKLPINFQIETDTDAVFKKVISLLINNLGKDKLITEYLVEFSLTQVEENKHWDPEKILSDFIKQLNKEGIKELIERLSQFEISDFEEIKKQLNDYIKDFESTLVNLGNDGLSLIQSKALTEKAFYRGASGVFSFYKKLLSVKEKYEAKENLFNSYINTIITEDKWYSTTATANEIELIDSIKTELAIIISKAEKYILENEEHYIVFKLIKKHIYAIGLVNELAKLIEQYKADENILFISEFNQLISEVICDEPTPFIFERLGDRYKHFLLDEFQDTSGMQWLNMLPLVDNSLAGGNLNLIVGDGKQSIYRWRNADVKQFVDLPTLKHTNNNPVLIEREQSLIRNFNEKLLDTNFRSDSVIVDFNNQLFEFLSQQFLTDDLKKIYHNHHQKHKNNLNGFVSIEFPENTENSDVDVNLLYTLKHINNAIADGYEYKDVCIIVRANKNGNTIANYLIKHKIPVISSESLLLNNSFEINVIISFLKYIANQKDLVSASVVLNYLYQANYCNQQQYVEFLKDLNQQKTKNLFSICSSLNITIQLNALLSINLFDTCILIINALKLNKQNPQYIRFFLDEVLNFLTSHSSNNSQFIEWWEKRQEKASLIIPEGINAVNIMTVHASKGLEFPIVITPYANWNLVKNESVWVDVEDEKIGLPVALLSTGKSLESTKYKTISETEEQQQILDNLNILYVDFTRAVERLHIISPEPNKIIEKSCYTWLLNFAKSCENFNSEKQKLEFGTLQPKVTTEEKYNHLQQLQIEELNTIGNKEAIQIKGSASYNYNDELVKAREYGILVHHILSQIKTEADISVIIQNNVLLGNLSDLEAIQIKHDITQLIALPNVKPYFEIGLDIKNELEILTAQGELLRPDRVIIKNNEAVVIDYKTGKRNPQKYYNQLSSYELALKELGYTSVKKILLYIQEQEVEVVN